jgi:hypothetical protein
MTTVPLENCNDRNIAVPKDARVCCTCYHFERNAGANPKSGEVRQGLCVAGPPTAVMIGQGVNALGQTQTAVQGIWPPTFANKRCGAWTPEDVA